MEKAYPEDLDRKFKEQNIYDLLSIYFKFRFSKHAKYAIIYRHMKNAQYIFYVNSYQERKR